MHSTAQHSGYNFELARSAQLNGRGAGNTGLFNDHNQRSFGRGEYIFPVCNMTCISYVTANMIAVLSGGGGGGGGGGGRG